MLTVQNINQYYGGSHILRDVSLTAAPGKVTVLLGRNGVGKTTLLKSLMGLVPIKSGSITFDGQPIHHQAPYDRARAGIGFVPQGREIFGRLTVEDNLRMGLAYKSASTPIPPELFELFPVLKQMLQRRGGDLWQHLRCQKPRRKRYASGQEHRGTIKNRIGIDERPEIVDQKSRIGDWEGDTIAGKKGKSALVSLRCRKSRKVLFAKVKDTVALGEKIYRGGIAEKAVPACAGCHSPNGAGIPTQFPRLSGQHAGYVEAQLKNFRYDAATPRKNSAQMTPIANRLSDQEIKALAAYIQGLQ